MTSVMPATDYLITNETPILKVMALVKELNITMQDIQHLRKIVAVINLKVQPLEIIITNNVRHDYCHGPDSYTLQELSHHYGEEQFFFHVKILTGEYRGESATIHSPSVTDDRKSVVVLIGQKQITLPAETRIQLL